MEEQLYTVLDGNIILASNMTIDSAMILVKGLFEKYYEEPRMTLTIDRVPRSIIYGNQEVTDGHSED